MVRIIGPPRRAAAVVPFVAPVLLRDERPDINGFRPVDKRPGEDHYTYCKRIFALKEARRLRAVAARNRRGGADGIPRPRVAGQVNLANRYNINRDEWCKMIMKREKRWAAQRIQRALRVNRNRNLLAGVRAAAPRRADQFRRSRQIQTLARSRKARNKLKRLKAASRIQRFNRGNASRRRTLQMRAARMIQTRSRGNRIRGLNLINQLRTNNDNAAMRRRAVLGARRPFGNDVDALARRAAVIGARRASGRGITRQRSLGPSGNRPVYSRSNMSERDIRAFNRNREFM
jgi:hypothetical protein